MKNLTLRTEYLGELTTEELSRVGGAAKAFALLATVSDGSCGCTLSLRDYRYLLGCDNSDGSCECGYRCDDT